MADSIQKNFSSAGAPVLAATGLTVPPQPLPPQRKRRREIADDEDVEVMELSIEEIDAKKLFFCQYCNKRFIREQNLILHGKVHDLPNVRLNRNGRNRDDEKRKVYVCPVTTCAHHHRPNALSDLTGLRKHYKRKHDKKTLRCTKCNRTYAVDSDLRAHLKVCGTKEYVCECGSSFARRDSYLAHKIPCDASVDKQLSPLRNESQANNTATIGSLFGSTTSNDSISFFNNPVILSSNIAESHTSQAIVGSSFLPTIFDESVSFFNNQPLNSNTATNMDSFPFLSDTVVAPPLSNFPPSNQSGHLNITTTDLANNKSIQGTELNNDIFDIQTFHDNFSGFSSVATTLIPPEVSQQGFTLADSGTSASFSGNLECPSASYCFPDIFSMDHKFNNTSSGNSHFPMFESPSGTYENQNQLIDQGNNIGDNILNLQGDYESSTIANDNIFGTSLEDKTRQTLGLSGLGTDQINQEQQSSGQRVGIDDHFPVLQDDFSFLNN